MAMRDIEMIIGRLVTDEEFRVRFYQDPVRVCIEARLRLSPLEIEALAKVPADAFEVLAQTMDEHLVRTPLVGRANRWFTKPHKVRISRYKKESKNSG